MCDLVHAYCLSLGRCNEPPYLAEVNLASPWYIMPKCPGLLKACSSCCPMHFV